MRPPPTAKSNLIADRAAQKKEDKAYENKEKPDSHAHDASAVCARDVAADTLHSPWDHPR